MRIISLVHHLVEQIVPSIVSNHNGTNAENQFGSIFGAG